MKISVTYQLARFLVAPKPTTLIPVLLRSRQSNDPQSRSLSIHSLHSPPLVSSALERNILLKNIRNMASLVRQNFAEECEAGLNRQINLELYASYVYSSMAFHFDRDDVALPGFHKFFKSRSDDERGHAEKLMKYQNMRGGRILLQDIRKPECDEWGSGLEAMTSALKLEKSVNQSLLDLHKVAEGNNDVQFGDFLEGEFLEEQVEDIKEIANYVKQLTRVGPGVGEYMFDKETLQELK